MTTSTDDSQPATPKPVVYVVDDDDALRDSLQVLLSSVGHVCRTYPSADDFLAHVDPEVPGCLLLDVRMPGTSGMELQRKLAEDRMPLPIILMTGHGDVGMAVESMRAGALDFIEKPFKEQELLGRVRECLNRSAVDWQRDRQRRRAEQRLERLTPRERQVLDGLVAGKLSKTIAHELGISRKTVDVHRANVMDKVGVRTVAELVRFALQAHRE
jgi:two-component system response regulator FixJ